MNEKAISHCAIWTALTACMLVGRAALADDGIAAQLQVPKGFAVELAAGAPHLQFPMFAAQDDQGRLYVAESSGHDLYAELQQQTRNCRVSRLADRDGDGLFETSTVFADKLVFPMGLAWRAGKLYVADPPDLVVYEDADGDGRGDERRVILTGFGHKDNGSLHGLTFGPDGWLYMTMGSPDGYKLRRADGSLVEGESGALIRCRPDGSQPEVVCRGFVNLVEVAFTARGEPIGTDNWFRDVNQPGSNGLRDALVHLVDGGLYPYHPEVGTPQATTGVELPPLAHYPAVALSGIELYRGTQYPAEMRGQLFTAQHNARKVARHQLLAAGATFRAEDTDFVWSENPDFHPSDVLEAPDGSLLVVDTGSWYIHHCPTGRIRDTRAIGGIYRVRRQGVKPLRDAVGRNLRWQHLTAAQLVPLLADDRSLVRDRATEALVAAGELAVPKLAQWANNASAASSARLLAVWTLSRIDAAPARTALRDLLPDDDEDIASTAARALGRAGDRDSAAALAELLRSPAAPLRLAAAEALAQCGNAAQVAQLWASLAAEEEPLVEHALVHAAHFLANETALVAALRHPHPRVQKAALVLLSQPPRQSESLTHEMVAPLVAADDAELQQAALKILQSRPAWTEPALALLEQWLRQSRLTPDRSQALRGTLVAFAESPRVQELVAAALTSDDRATPAPRRVDVLQAISAMSIAEPPPAWITALQQTIADAEGEVQAQAVRTAALLQAAPLDDVLAHFADDDRQPAALRIEAVRAIVARQPEISSATFAVLSAQIGGDADPLLRLRAAEVLGQAELNDAQRRALIAAVRRDALLSPDTIGGALMATADADVAAAALEYFAEALRRDWRPSADSLARLLARVPESLAAQADALRKLSEQQEQRQRGLLADFQPLLAGGDPQRGRDVFFAKKTACASCHRVGDEGGSVGPDLSRIGAIRAPQDLLESIALPSSTFAQGFNSYTVATLDGRLASGVIARQDDRLVVLRDASGSETRIARGEIETIEPQTKSLMPEGLPRTMSPAEFRDLLAYLQALR